MIFPSFLPSMESSNADFEIRVQHYRREKIEKMLFNVIKAYPEMSAKDAVKKAIELVDCLNEAHNVKVP